MIKSSGKFAIRLTFCLAFILFLLPFLKMTVSAGMLSEGYLFFSRTHTNTATDITIMFTPGAGFSGEGDIIFRIYFPEGNGAWCLLGAGEALNIAGVGAATSPIDQGDWSIDLELPAENPGVVDLSAGCYQGPVGGNDYIEVTGIGALTAGTSYGFKIDAAESVFQTGANVGSNLISFQLIEDDNVENLTFPVALLGKDQVAIAVEVVDSDTITCTVGADVNLGILFLGGTYVTGGHDLSTNSVPGFYWAVYGQGDDSDAGLLHDNEIDLLSSEGVGGVVNLISGEGLGLVIEEPLLGNVIANYQPNGGIFGAISIEPNLIIESDAGGSATFNVTLGARAGIEATPGSYSETLTYICGGYIGTPIIP